MNLVIDPRLFQDLNETVALMVIKRLSDLILMRQVRFVVEKSVLAAAYDDLYEELLELSKDRKSRSAEIHLALGVLGELTSSSSGLTDECNQSKWKSDPESGSSTSKSEPVDELKLADEESVLLNVGQNVLEATVILSLTQVGDGETKKYQEMRNELCTQWDRDAIYFASEFARPEVEILGEGNTDILHFRAALQRLKREKHLFCGLRLHFYEYESHENTGWSSLRARCRNAESNARRNDRNNDVIEKITVCIFDRDDEQILKDACDSSNKYEYKSWADSWYSFALPVPSHRPDAERILYLCTEFYYRDEHLLLKDKNGRRLYLSTEFDEHGVIPSENAEYKNNKKKHDKRYRTRIPTVIDANVQNRTNGLSVALSKTDFARYVTSRERPFDNVEIDSFALIFEAVETILFDKFP